LQGLILEEVGASMRDDISDPALSNVWITAVVLSHDYRHARVHYAAPSSAERALPRAAPFLRARLAEAIDVKRVPDLRFVLDGGA
jgi:ribosome-binding factor A